MMMMCNPVYLHNTVTVKDPIEYPRQLQWIFCRNIIILSKEKIYIINANVINGYYNTYHYASICCYCPGYHLQHHCFRHNHRHNQHHRHYIIIDIIVGFYYCMMLI